MGRTEKLGEFGGDWEMFVATKEMAVRGRDIIGVFDLDTATVSGVTKNFLASAEKRREVRGTDNLPKSFILVSDVGDKSRRGQSKIYLSARLANYVNK